MNDNPSPGAQILPFTPGGHEDAAGTAIRWLSDRHRKASEVRQNHGLFLPDSVDRSST